jgi:hypothetical protein
VRLVRSEAPGASHPRRRLLLLTAAILLAVTIGFAVGRKPFTDEATQVGQEEWRGPTRSLIELLNRPPVLTQAEELVTGKCMRRKGFRYPLRLDPLGPDRPRTLAGEPLTVAVAGREGYEFSGGGPSPRQTFLQRLPPELEAKARDALVPSGSPRVGVRLLGSWEVDAAQRGCVAKGRREVYGSVRNFLILWYGPQVIGSMIDRYLVDAIDAPKVAEATSSYSRCMREGGFDVATPRAAWRLARQDFDHGGDRVTSGEKRMATLDARCQKSSRIYGTLSRELADAASEVLEGHAARIARMRVMMRSSIRRAAMILAAHGMEAG